MLLGSGALRLEVREARHQANGDEAGDGTGRQKEVEDTDHEHVEFLSLDEDAVYAPVKRALLRLG
jgi:hypothetical protein